MQSAGEAVNGVEYDRFLYAEVPVLVCVLHLMSRAGRRHRSSAATAPTAEPSVRGATKKPLSQSHPAPLASRT
jgi:hypothetical protein